MNRNKVKSLKRWTQIKRTNTRMGDLLIARGRIDQSDLDFALQKQRENGEKLGAILLKERRISRFTLLSTLSQQVTTRFALIALGVFLSVGGVQVGFAKADNGYRMQATKVAYNMAARGPSSADRGLFGKSEVISTNLSAFKKWTGVLARMSDRAHAPSALENMFTPYGLKPLDTIKQMPLKARINHINSVVNKISYRDDSQIFGTSDYWATPKEIVARGQADCEDYAIAKYALLKAVGVPEHMLRLSIVKDTKQNIPHAILVVFHDDGSKDVLDNQIAYVKEASAITHYNPLYSINSQAWWRHI